MGVTRNEDVKCLTTIAQKPQGENGIYYCTVLILYMK